MPFEAIGVRNYESPCIFFIVMKSTAVNCGRFRLEVAEGKQGEVACQWLNECRLQTYRQAGRRGSGMYRCRSAVWTRWTSFRYQTARSHDAPRRGLGGHARCTEPRNTSCRTQAYSSQRCRGSPARTTLCIGRRSVSHFIQLMVSQFYAKEVTRKPTRPKRSRLMPPPVSKPNFGVVWPWSSTTWPQNLIVSSPCP